MKKAIMMLLMGMFTTVVFAQEVRGIETRRVIYNGPEYETGGIGGYYKYTEYYGWELTNRNSFPVSVDITLWVQIRPDPNRIVKTQSVILKPGESYIFKREEHSSTWVHDNHREFSISQYYIEYKAYKLQ